MSVGDFIRNSQVWKSIFRHPAPRDRRNRVVVMLTNVFLHLHPAKINRDAVRYSYTWGMGGITFYLFVVLTFTGAAMDANTTAVKLVFAIGLALAFQALDDGERNLGEGEEPEEARPRAQEAASSVGECESELGGRGHVRGQVGQRDGAEQAFAAP